ncbi:MAG: hypothetical protein NZ610_01430 [Candidatus Bipolaricaulota bacterium]|nr:hypothetical protein [Candidatus Bipolaricaulota bacterium]MCS7274054.1 hypothetical protein [Candidatus Bipolaricaulota bacterium]MDW8110651.1 hypothetical protein [Candidatus Bipolaricaulota bacterium]MDW8328491.1 hypothetical protein [Candidatus Bipolaricaulota bacterium]
MPYIAPHDRRSLDPLIDRLAEQIVEQAKTYTHDAAFAGLLNYACTRLALKVIRLRFGALRYWIIAITTGVFKNIADEFYRRLGALYEQKQIAQNGDVDLYAEFEEKLKS